MKQLESSNVRDTACVTAQIKDCNPDDLRKAILCLIHISFHSTRYRITFLIDGLPMQTMGDQLRRFDSEKDDVKKFLSDAFALFATK